MSTLHLAVTNNWNSCNRSKINLLKKQKTQASSSQLSDMNPIRIEVIVNDHFLCAKFGIIYFCLKSRPALPRNDARPYLKDE